MIIISVMSFFSALSVMYFFLKKSINTYKKQKRNSILEQIQREIVENDELQKMMLKSSKSLENIQHKKELTCQNMTIMKKNSFKAVTFRKEKLKKQYEDMYLNKFEVMRIEIVERVILDILKNVDQNDHALIANIQDTIKKL